MNVVKMMVLDGCPHCKHAFQMIEELKQEHSEYQTIDIEVIEENREAQKTEGYDYWYVPTFFVNDIKLHEGVPTKDKIKQVLQAAIL